VLHVWGSFFAEPGTAIATAWDSAFGAYNAMFQGVDLQPAYRGRDLPAEVTRRRVQRRTVSQVFDPISETAVNATPLILAGLAVALAFRAGLFNIGAQSQFIGGALVCTYLGFGSACRRSSTPWSACSARSSAAR